jgi:hypothetical protein
MAKGIFFAHASQASADPVREDVEISDFAIRLATCEREATAVAAALRYNT